MSSTRSIAIRRSTPGLVTGAMLAIGLANAGAQPAPRPAPIPGVVRPPNTVLEKGYEDIAPLAESMRLDPVDLRVDASFEEVRPVPGSSDLLMRQSGGLYAAFPRSEYDVTQRGDVVTVIPAGTVFFIGPVPAQYLAHVRGGTSSVRSGSAPDAPHTTDARGPTGVLMSTMVPPSLAVSQPLIAARADLREPAARVQLTRPIDSLTPDADTPQPTPFGTAPPVFTLDSEAFRRVRLRQIAARLTDAPRS